MHALIRLAMHGVDGGVYLALSPVIFGLPLSICANYGKSASNALKARLGIQGPVAAPDLFAKALCHPDHETRLMAESYWRWQAWGACCTGVFVFWALALIHYLFRVNI